MLRKGGNTTFTIYIPKEKRAEGYVQRLVRLAEQDDRSVNYLIVEAIGQYLEYREK